jgi:L-ascorbate metabolism protein UlaG (beta-lactamase superfamily)
MIATHLSVSRIINACVLLELNGDAVLTDPYFDHHWFIRMREPIGMNAADLPKLSAIIGGHRVADHWHPKSLAQYRFKKATPVFVAAAIMREKAKAVGFCNIEVLEWNQTRKLSECLTLEVAPAQTTMGLKVNSYVLDAPGLRVFVGTEARDLEPLARYRASRPAVDIAILPIDGSALMGHKLVMDPADALMGARILGARTLVPIHYALKPVPALFQTPGSLAELLRLARGASDIEIVPLETGKRWNWSPQKSANR